MQYVMRRPPSGVGTLQDRQTCSRHMQYTYIHAIHCEIVCIETTPQGPGLAHKLG